MSDLWRDQRASQAICRIIDRARRGNRVSEHLACEGAQPLGTTRGVEYVRVGVVLARDASDGTVVGIYATERQWPETSAAALIERETDNTRLRAALAAQEAQNTAQGAELARLRAQLAEPLPDRYSEPAAVPLATPEPRTPMVCPVPTCLETRATGQALGRHCQTAHGVTLSVLREQYAAANAMGRTAAVLASTRPVPQPDTPALTMVPREGSEECPVPGCGVQLSTRPLAHHAIDVHGELLTVLRHRYAASASAAPADAGAT